MTELFLGRNQVMIVADTMQDALSTLKYAHGSVGQYYRLGWLEEQGLGVMSRLPYSLRVLLESAMRNCDGRRVTRAQVEALAAWTSRGPRSELSFVPTRVLLQDFTGVPAVVDLAACRDAVAELGGNPQRVNPAVEVDLVVDHSVQVDVDGRHPGSLLANLDHEYGRNEERYRLLKWARERLANFRVVPPGRGIVHQVNLEWLASVVGTREIEGQSVEFEVDVAINTQLEVEYYRHGGILPRIVRTLAAG